MPDLGYVKNMIANTVIEMEMPAYLAYRTANQKFVDQFADQFAKWMAYNELAGDPRYQGKKELSAEEKNRIEKNAEALAENFRSSRGFKEMFKPDNVKETIEMFCGKKETWKGPSSPEPLDYDIVRESFLGKLTEYDKMRDRTKDIVKRLDGTLSKSFTGRLKSFFVGNSKEYDAAYKALDDVAKGKSSPEEAKDAVMQYLDLRGKKVRDHQYGKDRFDAMLSGLSTIMEPMEFEQYCDKLNKVRGAIDKSYKGHIDATKYMSDEAKQKLEETKQQTEPAKEQPKGPEMQ